MIIVASDNTKIGAHFRCCFAGCCGSIAAAQKAQGVSKKKKKSPPKNKKLLYGTRRSVGRSHGPVFPAVSSAGWRVCYFPTITHPPLSFHCQHSTPSMVQQVVWFDCFYSETPRLLWFYLYSLQTKTVCPVA